MDGSQQAHPVIAETNVSGSIVTGAVPLDQNSIASDSLIEGGGPGTNVISGAPQFWGIYDYHLLPGSIAINSAFGLPLDRDGSISEMGAFQFDGDYCSEPCDSSIGSSTCISVPNSTGQIGEVTALGTNVIEDDHLFLVASRLPIGQFGYFIAGRHESIAPNFGGGLGMQCLSTSQMIRRLNSPVVLTNLAGQGSRKIQILTDLPGTLLPGDTAYFQFWHRDFVNGQSVSNTSSSLARRV